MQDIKNEANDGLKFLINVNGLIITIPTDVLISVAIQNSKIKKMADYYFEHHVPAVLTCNQELFKDYILPYIAFGKIPETDATNKLGCTQQITKIAEELGLLEFLQRFKKCRLRINRSGSNDFFLSLHLIKTVKEIKEAIEYREGIPVDQIRLIYRSNILLDDSRSLEDMGVGSEDEMTFILRLRGD